MATFRVLFPAETFSHFGRLDSTSILSIGTEERLIPLRWTMPEREDDRSLRLMSRSKMCGALPPRAVRISELWCMDTGVFIGLFCLTCTKASWLKMCCFFLAHYHISIYRDYRICYDVVETLRFEYGVDMNSVKSIRDFRNFGEW
jgi:hypothetical protein